AVQAAYEGGRGWFEEVLGLIRSNYFFLKDGLDSRLPKARLTPLEGTYLAWLDLGAYLGSDDIEDTIKNKCGLAVDFGSWFGGQKYASFIRINLATSRENIESLLNRLEMIGEDM
ncbi:MAG: aminotransferase, partial [Peptostreptococcus sp.]|nr:aminotransferase [Peptostreptococcus sp.]